MHEKSRNLKGVIFDVDGPIIEPWIPISQSYQCVLRHFGLPTVADEVLRSCIGPPINYCFTQILGLSRDQVEEAFQIYRAHYDSLDPQLSLVQPGVKEMLFTLRNEGLAIGTASMKLPKTISHIFSSHQLMPYFDYIGGSLEGKRDNDKGEIIERALKGLRLKPEEVIMVGDRADDLFAARKVGVPAVAVTYGYGSREEFAEYNPIFVADSAQDLENFVLNLALANV